ncbi:MAG: type II CAAX endopeptidase family protein [Kiritimatiellae bacterium]|nr:type II CAAX endopeptidase family protein [Kiritimatiellia bacterium]
METVNIDIFLITLRFMALIFFGGAVTLDLFFLFKLADSEHRFEFAELKCLKARGMALPIAALALLTTLVFTLPNQIFVPDVVHEIKPSGLLLGSLIYALAVLLVVFFAVIYSRCSVKQIFLSEKTTYICSLKKGIVYGIAAVPPVFFLTAAMSTVVTDLGFVAESQPVIDWLTNPETSLSTRIVIIICAVVIAPVIEEIIFRGLLFPAVLKHNSFIFSALLVGCIFSLVHFHAPSFLSILVLNIFFCAAYSITGSLITPIVMHMIFNGSATFIALVVL